MDAWIRQRRGAPLTGLLVILSGCGLYAAGWLQRLDEIGLDFHFRHFSSIPVDPRIVMVDIDDQSLRAAPWPWTRRTFAELVRTLTELNSQAIVLDIVFSEATDPRREHAALRDLDIDPNLPRNGNLQSDPVIYDDRELAAAIAEAGNVYLSMFFDMAAPWERPEESVESAISLFRKDPAMSYESFRENVSIPAKWDVKRLYDQCRVAAQLEKDFGLDAKALAPLVGLTETEGIREVESHLASAKRPVAKRKARHFMVSNPEGSFRQFFDVVLPGTDCDTLTADRSDLGEAYRWATAERIVLARSARAKDNDAIAHAFDGTYPLAAFAQSAKGVGMVSFVRSSSSGVVRSIPLVAHVGDPVVFQLGLLVATDSLGVSNPSVDTSGNGTLALEGIGQVIRLPIDRTGGTLVNWHVPPRRSWEHSFVHIPAARLVEVAHLRAGIEENKRRNVIVMGELLSLRHAETPAEYARYERLVNEALAIDQRRSSIPDPNQATREHRLPELRAEIRAMQEDAIVWLKRVWALWQQNEPQTPKEREERQRIAGLHETIVTGNLDANLSARNEKLAARAAAVLNELRPLIDQKICFVGYTASAVADLVTVPPYPAMPGVMAHANVCNMVLQNRPVWPVSLWTHVGLMLVAGAVMTLVATTRGPVSSLVTLGSISVAVLAVGAAAFYWSDQSLSTPAIVANTGIVWAAVTARRQLTEERARRSFERALRQYTSPAVAAKIAQNFDAAALAPKPATVTCFYSDLAGFTRLSEQLGPERTRLVLNPYLASLTQVLAEHGAIVNKFMGDGVFAFFNAPILRCPDHAAAACGAALDAKTALAEINRRIAPICGDGTPLVMRIGLATGPVFVGDFGSNTKLDYTCIGDAVNLGSRLEAAGKVLGGGILADETTRQGATAGFVFRNLGRFEVAGRTAPVTVHELLGVTDHLDSRTLDFARHFEQAVASFQACRWDDCRASMEQCRSLRPDDRAVQLYWQELPRRSTGLQNDPSRPISLVSL